MRFNRKYGEPMLKNLVATRGWCRVACRPIHFEHFGAIRTDEIDWIEKHCKKDVQYCDGYLYFQEPAEATAFVLFWQK